MSSLLRILLLRRGQPLRFFYSTDDAPQSKPPIRVKTPAVSKTKKAGLIKNLHRENKEMFGELLETKRDKVFREKKMATVPGNVASKPHETVFVAVRQQQQGPLAERFNSGQTVHVPSASVKMDADASISKHGDTGRQKKTTKAIESDWMVKSFSKRTKILSRIPPVLSAEQQLTEKSGKVLPPQQLFSTSKTQPPTASPKLEMSPKELREIPTLKQFLTSVDQRQDINHYGEVKHTRQDGTTEVRSGGGETDRQLESVINDDEQKLIEGIDDTDGSLLHTLKPASYMDAKAGAEAITRRSKGINKGNTSSSHDPLPPESDPNPLRVSADDMISAGYKLFPFDNPGRQTTDEDDRNLRLPSTEILSFPYPRSSENYATLQPNAKAASVTRILTATMSPQQVKILKQWEEKMIKELGEDGFKEYKEELFRNGKLLHGNLHALLSGKSMNDLQISPPIEGHWRSLQTVLKEIHKVSVLESFVSHPELGYNGIVDCVAQYRDKLVLIDWKTSEKPKPFISNTYDTPLQIAAYVGAINYDPSYEFKVVEGLVVIAYKDGKDCQLFPLNSFDILKYWKIWLQRLKLYHARETEN